jgi:hypothetical protein
LPRVIEKLRYFNVGGYISYPLSLSFFMAGSAAAAELSGCDSPDRFVPDSPHRNRPWRPFRGHHRRLGRGALRVPGHRGSRSRERVPVSGARFHLIGEQVRVLPSGIVDSTATTGRIDGSGRLVGAGAGDFWVSGMARRCQRGPGKEFAVRSRSRFEPSEARGVMPARDLGRGRAMASYQPTR